MTVAKDAPVLDSPAFHEVVSRDIKPSFYDGGPCETCAFRAGTEANRSAHTVALAQLCVEGLTPFHCHERPAFCRGWIAAVNLKHEIERDAPNTFESRMRVEAMRMAADVLSRVITMIAEREK